MSITYRPGSHIVISMILLGLLVFTWCLSADVQRGIERRTAIAHHAARYNPTTGMFEWLDDVQP